MCGKFTARASWTEIVDLAWAASGAEGDNDRPLIYRVMSDLAVIVRHGGARQVMPMRWGFPDAKDWRKPRPIHARGETIDAMPAFADAFRDGQRGIVLVETFNEAADLGDKGSGPQHTITPAGPVGIAFVWRRFDIAALPAPLLACAMATVPANALIAALPTDRMPAILAPEDWAIWLGEEPASAGRVKACLRRVEDVRWTMTREERASNTRRARPVISDPGGLF